MIISMVMTITFIIIIIIIVIFAVVKKSNFFDKESRNLGFVSITTLYRATLVWAFFSFKHTQMLDSPLYYKNLSFLNLYILASYLLVDYPSWPGGSKHSPR